MAPKIEPPLKIWLLFAVLGGVLGTLNPAWFVLNPEYAGHIVKNFGFEYSRYGSTILGFFFFLLFIPAFLSTLILYPWFFRKVRSQWQQRKAGHLRLITTGFFFGCLASFPTAFFFLTQIVILTDEVAASNLFIVPLGTPLLAFTGILISLPGMAVTGWIFSYMTLQFIKRNTRLV